MEMKGNVMQCDIYIYILYIYVCAIDFIDARPGKWEMGFHQFMG